jgi:hypothetical protein
VDPTRAAVAAALLAGVALLVLLRARRRAAPFRPRLLRLPDDAFPAGPRAPLTAFHVTSRLCAACRETPGIVREAAPELALVELPVHERPDLARALGVSETPTLLLVDAEGRIRHARVGNPAPEELRARVREARRAGA